jgi:hypothetical protein
MSVTAALILLSGYRLQQQGKWLPPLPDDYNSTWSAYEVPLSQASLAKLGYPKAAGRYFVNPFGERVDTHIIATRSLDSYTEPAMLLTGYGFGTTAEKLIPLFGKDRLVRALILRNEASGTRILMYYWVQYKGGSTETRVTQHTYKDVFPKLRIGLEAIIRGEQNCIVRVYTQVHPADHKGVQARRNLNAISRALYESMTGQKVPTTSQNTAGNEL